MPDIVVVGGRASFAPADNKIFVGSDIEIDANLSISVVTLGLVVSDAIVFNDCPIGVFHVTYIFSLFSETNGEHGGSICVPLLDDLEADTICVL